MARVVHSVVPEGRAEQVQLGIAKTELAQLERFVLVVNTQGCRQYAGHLEHFRHPVFLERRPNRHLDINQRTAIAVINQSVL